MLKIFWSGTHFTKVNEGRKKVIFWSFFWYKLGLPYLIRQISVLNSNFVADNFQQTSCGPQELIVLVALSALCLGLRG